MAGIPEEDCMWWGWGGHLLEDVSVFHFTVELGKFDGQNNAGDEKDQAPAQAEPERILWGEGGREEGNVMKCNKRSFSQYRLLTKD